MKIKFTPIGLKDISFVLSLFKTTAEKINKMGVAHWQYWCDPPPEKIQWVEEGIRNHEFFFIEEISGANVGMVRILNEDLQYWGEQKERAKYVHSLVIREEYNGRGLGSIVLQEIENMGKKDMSKYLRLDSDSKNPKLCEYYEKLDFKKVGIKELPLSNYQLYQKEIV